MQPLRQLSDVSNTSAGHVHSYSSFSAGALGVSSFAASKEAAAVDPLHAGPYSGDFASSTFSSAASGAAASYDSALSHAFTSSAGMDAPAAAASSSSSRSGPVRYPTSLLPGPGAPKFSLADFEIAAKPLGSGKFGRVFRVREKRSRAILAMKIVDKAAVEGDNVKHQLRREVELHCRLFHPHIVRLYAYFHDAANAYLIQEFASGGNLYNRLALYPGRRLPEALAATYVYQLVSALAYTHANNVIHRDIKPENLLLTRDPATGVDVLKLADFGWSVCQRAGSRRTTLCGTVEYLPPEAIHGHEYGSAFDMWTVGVLTYEVLVGYSPFADPSRGEDQDQGWVMSRIVAGDVNPLPPDVSPAAAHLIGSLLQIDQAARMSAAATMRHPWLAEAAAAAASAGSSSL